jgi:hypothetical protein
MHVVSLGVVVEWAFLRHDKVFEQQTMTVSKTPSPCRVSDGRKREPSMGGPCQGTRRIFSRSNPIAPHGREPLSFFLSCFACRTAGVLPPDRRCPTPDARRDCQRLTLRWPNTALRLSPLFPARGVRSASMETRHALRTNSRNHARIYQRLRCTLNSVLKQTGVRYSFDTVTMFGFSPFIASEIGSIARHKPLLGAS